MLIAGVSVLVIFNANTSQTKLKLNVAPFFMLFRCFLFAGVMAASFNGTQHMTFPFQRKIHLSGEEITLRFKTPISSGLSSLV